MGIMGNNNALIVMIIPKENELKKIRGRLETETNAQRSCQDMCMGNCNILHLKDIKLNKID